MIFLYLITLTTKNNLFMKTNILKISVLALIFSFASCSKDDADNSTTTETPTVMTEAQVESDIKTEIKAEDFSNDFAGMYDEIPTSAGKGTIVIPDGPKICDITPEKALTLPNLTYTYNLGDTGCTRNGKTVKGKLVISVNVLTKAITFTFTNFNQGEYTLNGVMLITKSFNDKKERVINTQLRRLTIKTPDGTVDKSSNYVQTQIAGNDTETEADDEFSTTGTWTTIFSDGKQNVVTIKNPLIIKTACTSIGLAPRFVKGSIEFKIRGNMGSLDFGDGTCKSKWTLKVNNKTVEVVSL